MGNVEKDDKVINLPWYMTMFLETKKLDKPIQMKSLSTLDELI